MSRRSGRIAAKQASPARLTATERFVAANLETKQPPYVPRFATPYRVVKREEDDEVEVLEDRRDELSDMDMVSDEEPDWPEVSDEEPEGVEEPDDESEGPEEEADAIVGQANTEACGLTQPSANRQLATANTSIIRDNKKLHAQNLLLVERKRQLEKEAERIARANEREREAERLRQLKNRLSEATAEETDACAQLEKREGLLAQMEQKRADERVAHNADMEAADVEIATLYRMIEQKRQRQQELQEIDAAKERCTRKEREDVTVVKAYVKQLREDRINASVEVDEHPHSKERVYSRMCGVCYNDNPGQRVVMTTCGHMACLNCAQKLDRVNKQAPGITVSCPTCRRATHYVEVFEDEREPARPKRARAHTVDPMTDREMRGPGVKIPRVVHM